MNEQEFKNDKYYLIKKNVFWRGVVIVGIIILMLMFRVYADVKTYVEEKFKESYHIKYGKIDSKLEQIEECYLCGNADRSLMGYYRKFDTIGIIGLNEWYVLDLRLKNYDEYGNEIYGSDSVSMSGGMTQGVQFEVEAITSRGRSRATISSEEAFEANCIENNLCQMCLNKVTSTLERYCKEGEKEMFNPFVLVDFETLDIYSLQGNYTGMSIRDYWVEVELSEGKTIVDAYYLPDRNQ